MKVGAARSIAPGSDGETVIYDDFHLDIRRNGAVA